MFSIQKEAFHGHVNWEENSTMDLLLCLFQVTHYRFSVAWTRVLPNGTADNINDKGKYIEFVLPLPLYTKLQKINKMTKRAEKCWSRCQFKLGGQVVVFLLTNKDDLMLTSLECWKEMSAELWFDNSTPELNFHYNIPLTLYFRTCVLQRPDQWVVRCWYRTNGDHEPLGSTSGPRRCRGLD